MILSITFISILVTLFVGAFIYFSFIAFLIPTDFELTQDRDQIEKIEIFINRDSTDELGELVKEIPPELHDSFVDDLLSVTLFHKTPPSDKWYPTQIKIQYADGNYEVIFDVGRYISASNHIDGYESFDTDEFIAFLNKYGVEYVPLRN